MCAKKSSDIDLEFLKFEEEISKLTAAPEPPPPSSNAVISAAPVSVITFKSNTNFQLPTVKPQPPSSSSSLSAGSGVSASASALLFQPTSVTKSTLSSAPVVSSSLAFKPSQLKTPSGQLIALFKSWFLISSRF